MQDLSEWLIIRDGFFKLVYRAKKYPKFDALDKKYSKFLFGWISCSINQDDAKICSTGLEKHKFYFQSTDFYEIFFFSFVSKFQNLETFFSIFSFYYHTCFLKMKKAAKISLNLGSLKLGANKDQESENVEALESSKAGFGTFGGFGKKEPVKLIEPLLVPENIEKSEDEPTEEEQIVVEPTTDVARVMGFSSFGDSKKAKQFDISAMFDEARQKALDRNASNNLKLSEEGQSCLKQETIIHKFEKPSSAAKPKAKAGPSRPPPSSEENIEEFDSSSDDEFIGPPIPGNFQKAPGQYLLVFEICFALGKRIIWLVSVIWTVNKYVMDTVKRDNLKQPHIPRMRLAICEMNQNEYDLVDYNSSCFLSLSLDCLILPLFCSIYHRVYHLNNWWSQDAFLPTLIPYFGVQ